MQNPAKRFEAAYQAVKKLPPEAKMLKLDTYSDVAVSAQIDIDPSDLTRDTRKLGFLVRELSEEERPTAVHWLYAYEKPDGTIAAHDTHMEVIKNSSGGLQGIPVDSGTIPLESEGQAVQSTLDAVEGFLQADFWVRPAK